MKVRFVNRGVQLQAVINHWFDLEIYKLYIVRNQPPQKARDNRKSGKSRGVRVRKLYAG